MANVFGTTLLQDSLLSIKCIKGDVQFYLPNYFIMNLDLQHYNLRFKSNVLPSHPNKEIFKKSFTYGAKIWNDLPENVKDAETTVKFKKSYKPYYLNNDFNCSLHLLCFYMLLGMVLYIKPNVCIVYCSWAPRKKRICIF